MAGRKKRRRAREIQLGFEAITIEGGLLSPEWLSRVAQLNAGMQGESDYRIPKGLNLRDEIGRYWRIAQAHWNEFSSGRSAKADGTFSDLLEEAQNRRLLTLEPDQKSGGYVIRRRVD